MEPQKENFFTEIFKFAVIALFIVVPFRLFVAQPFIVSGESMSPTFETGEYLIVDQLSYRFDAPKRGDVVIFKYPRDTSKYFIKRLIGLPGETVEVRGSTVIIHGKDGKQTEQLDEPYVAQGNDREFYGTTKLSDTEYFVMGDNRRASSDSRIWGPVPKADMIGRAAVRLLPLARIHIFPGKYDISATDSTTE